MEQPRDKLERDKPSRLSSMENSTTESSGCFLCSSMESSFSACPRVRGNPSKRKPLAHSDLSRLSDTILRTSSSDTWEQQSKDLSYPQPVLQSHQFPLVNDTLDLLPQLAAAADFCSKEVPSCEVTDLEVFLQSRSLGALPRPRRAQEDGSDPVGWIVLVWANCHFEIWNSSD